MKGTKPHKVGSTKPTLCPSQVSVVVRADRLVSFNKIPSRLARSPGVRAMPPMLSVSALQGAVPSVGIRPTVAFSPYRDALLAGCTMDPSVSVAKARGAKPAATPTALPEDEPAGV